QVMNIIGNVEGKKVIILDDMIDTAGTVVQASLALQNAGATDVTVCCTHPVLSGPAIERLENSNIKEVIVTDTIPLHQQAQACKLIRVLPVAGLLSEAVRRIYYDDSVSSLFV
ncbi:MAG: ribose-phosphate diphosphokinase, partial [Syntrophales bacterium]